MTRSYVEIIMPAYNAEKTIEKSMQAIRDQSFKDWSLIVVDDASTDKTKEIADKQALLDSRITVLSTGKNSGVSAARNTALDFIKGDSYIAYCDADDVWESNHLEISLSFLSLGADLVYNNPRFIDENQNEVFPNFSLYNNFSINNLRKGNFLWISSVVHRGKIGLFDSELNSLEDYDLWIRAAKQGLKFKQHNNKTCTYLVKNTGMAQKGLQLLKKLQIKHIDFISPLKLHLACGTQYKDDYLNVDLYEERVDLRWDVAKIPLPDNTVDEIMAYHIIEHFDFFEVQNVLKEWLRVLKPGGRLHLETPDLLGTCKTYVKADESYRVQLVGHFLAFPWLPGQTHKMLFSENHLVWMLDSIGYKNIRRLQPDSIYYNNGSQDAELFLNMEGYK